MKVKKYEYTPRPGWSYSRSRILRECRRRYWLHYYGIKFGDAKISREVKRIRNLTSLPLEVGEAVHKTIAQSLKNVIVAGVPPSKDKLLSRGCKTLEIYLETKQFVEEVMGNGPDEKRISNAFGKVEKALTTFISRSLLPKIVSSLSERPASCIVDPPGYGECRIDGKKAYAKPDLIYEDDMGQTNVIDWKTGRSDNGENLIQLGGYILYAKDVLDYSMDDLEGRIIYLCQPQNDLTLRPTADSLDMIKKRILREMGQIEKCCSDLQNNIPKAIESFPKTMDSHSCLYCNFKHICNEQDYLKKYTMVKSGNKTHIP